MRVVVREVRAEDAELWVGLRRALWPDADPSDRSTVDEFFSNGNPPRRGGLSGLPWAFGGRVIELSLRAYVRGADKLPAPFVEGWFVSDEARRKGVGRQLIAAVERWAREHGYNQLGSDTELENELGLVTHLATGFSEVERVRFFIKNVAVDSAEGG
jgi:aminoglycoside 6'-N-acetyltransferase I